MNLAISGAISRLIFCPIVLDALNLDPAFIWRA